MAPEHSAAQALEHPLVETRAAERQTAKHPPVPDGHVLVGDRLTPSHQRALEAVRTILRWVGEDPERSGIKDTPARVLRALAEMTSGSGTDPAAVLGTCFEDSYDEVVVLKGVPFTSLCEHHMLPFSGTVDVGYLPNQKVVGLSKLARLVDCYSQRLQLQERLTRQVAEALVTHLEVRGAGVVVRAAHSCMSCRGVRKPGATMVTSTMLGVFREDGRARAELLSLFGGS